MRIAIIGMGAIGKERYKALTKLSSEGLRLEDIIVYDPFIPKEKRSEEFIWVEKLDEVRTYNPDWIFVCTPHDIATKILITIIPWGTKVLVEKPFCRNWREANLIYDLLEDKNRLHVGFNYRFMDGISQIIKDTQDGIFGDVISINMQLAHGGSPNDAASWKLDPIRVGKSCLLDPGIHLLDLLLNLESEVLISPIFGKSWRGFWNTGIDEEVHLLLENGNTIVNLQVSLVKWVSTFRIEVNGIEGYGIVDGRGKSYGTQAYRVGYRWGWLGSNSTQRGSEKIISVTDCSDSFYNELDCLFNVNKREYLLKPCTAKEALDAMELYARSMEVIK